MEKVKVIAKEYPKWHDKEMYIWYTRETHQGTWYYLVDSEDTKGRMFPDLYLGEHQIDKL
jgi:hypothetical protein